MEKELGISYPTVRNRLDGLIQTLGYQVDREETLPGNISHNEILNALEKGEITTEQATQQLRKAKK